MQDYIARFGHGSAKLARQAQSKEKVLAKMVAGGLAEKVVTDKVDTIHSPFVLTFHCAITFTLSVALELVTL